MTTPLERVESVACPRCSARQDVQQRRDAEGVWQPDLGAVLAACGWTRTATLRDQRAPLALADGRTATVAVSAYTVDAGDWYCSQRHSIEAVEGRRRDPRDGGREFFVDGGSSAGRIALAQKDRPEPAYAAHEVTLHCARSGCGAGLTAATNRIADTVNTLGWVYARDGKLLCSKRCGTLKTMSEASPSVGVTDLQASWGAAGTAPGPHPQNAAAKPAVVKAGRGR